MAAEPDFEASALGTKTHWDAVYAREISNFASHGDIGEIWFGDEPVAKMIEWVRACNVLLLLSPNAPASKIEDNIPDTASPTIDLGCGNGHMLFEMVRLPNLIAKPCALTREHRSEQAELGYTSLTGIDYSSASIALAKSIQESNHPDASVNFATADFMQYSIAAPPPPEYTHAFALTIDKGTFDAISLASGVPEAGAVSESGRGRIAAAYASAVSLMLAEGGFLLITSCNWTETELVDGFKECEF
ncbi:Methyltransferase-like protein 10 [Entophlyctis sp. JEL0112]|nr:Methyltransferase-like protein 10 [Entophlyctis sp. JEL0112]